MLEKGTEGLVKVFRDDICKVSNHVMIWVQSLLSRGEERKGLTYLRKAGVMTIGD